LEKRKERKEGGWGERKREKKRKRERTENGFK